jgi:hypothetical protein
VLGDIETNTILSQTNNPLKPQKGTNILRETLQTEEKPKKKEKNNETRRRTRWVFTVVSHVLEKKPIKGTKETKNIEETASRRFILYCTLLYLSKTLNETP